MSDQDIRPLFDGYLEPSETILWTGKPRNGLYLSKRVLVRGLSYMTILLCCTWGISHFFSKAVDSPLFHTVKGLFLFIVMVSPLLLGLLVVPLWYYLRWKKERQIGYAITDKRVLISEPFSFRSRITSIELADIKSPSCHIDFSGVTDVFFFHVGSILRLSIMFQKDGFFPCFQELEDGRAAYEIMTAAINKLHAQPTTLYAGKI